MKYRHLHKGDDSQPNLTPQPSTRPTREVDPDIGHWHFVSSHPTNLSTSSYIEYTLDLTTAINKFRDNSAWLITVLINYSLRTFQALVKKL